MDVFSHVLWTGAAAKALNHHVQKSGKKPLNVLATAFWGVFPDFFAFTPLFMWFFWNLITGGMSLTDLPRPEETDSPYHDAVPMFALAHSLYNFSHSLVIFLIVFAMVYVIWKRPVWELLGWPLHIFIDIPTHSNRFFPTPFLWPIADARVNGMPWADPWVFIPNVTLLVLVYFAFYLVKRHDRKVSAKEHNNRA